MDYRAFTVSAVLAIGVMGVAPICRADIVASDGGIAVRDAGVAAPSRGMTMGQVASKFGDPLTKVAAVGSPPISRWEYSGFVVYFERDHVIHAVVSESAPTNASDAAAPPAASAPAAAAPATPEPAPAAAPVQAPMAQATMAEPPVAQASVAQASVARASLAPPAASAAASEAPPPAPGAASSAAADSEAPAQP
jgi:hypothetical protein